MGRSAFQKESTWAYLFIAPQVLGVVLFVLGPIVFSFYLSFTEWDFMTAPNWIGLKNYAELFSDHLFWKVLGNTLYYTIGNIPLLIVFALLLALGLNQEIRFVTVYRAVFFIPVITSVTAVALVWSWMYNPDFGVINTILRALGLPTPGWIASPEWAMPSIILMSVWQGVGYSMVIFLAGLQGVPRELYEAARIDGANSIACFTKITIPLLSPTTFFVLIMALINSFQVFAQPFMMTNGGPADSTYVMVLYIYRMAFRWFDMGKASALSWILFAMIFIVTIFQFKYSDRWVHYG